MQNETLDMLEEQIQRDIKRLGTFGSNDQASRSKAVQDVAKLMEKLTEAENAMAKWTDDEERRKLDEERNKSTVELERQKQSMDWKRWLLEISKVAVPTLIPLIVWRKSFLEMLKFEETGRLTTSASRELRLPKIFNNK